MSTISRSRTLAVLVAVGLGGCLFAARLERWLRPVGMRGFWLQAANRSASATAQPDLGSVGRQTQPAMERASSFDDLPAILEAIRTAGAATLYEGLPHWRFEAKLLEYERQNARTVQLSSGEFYAETLPLFPEDGRQIRALIEAPDSYESHPTGRILCGGFHADYALRFSSQAGDLLVSLCLVLPASEWLDVEFAM